MSETISNHKRRATFPKGVYKLWVIGVESRRKKYYLFILKKVKKMTKNLNYL